MNRRFYNEEIWLDKDFRKLKSSLKTLYFYIWSKCDCVGFYLYDKDYLKLDTGENYTFDDFEKLIPFGLQNAGIGRFVFKNFIEVTQTKVPLSETYNPHKPLFRALQKNNLEYNSSLNQALSKLVVEVVVEVVEVVEDKKEKDQEKKSKNSFVPPSFEEFKKYCFENGFLNIAERAYKGYEASEPPWHDTKGNPIRSWRQKLQNVWFREDNKDRQIGSGLHQQKPDLIDKAIDTHISVQQMIKNDYAGNS